jgi:hypothetical protein
MQAQEIGSAGYQGPDAIPQHRVKGGVGSEMNFFNQVPSFVVTPSRNLACSSAPFTNSNHPGDKFVPVGTRSLT